MIRIIIENVLLFLLPAGIYVAYMLLVRKSDNNPRQILDEAPLIALFIAGAAVVMATLLWFGATMNEGRPGQAYEPPSVKDGKIEPGRLR
jgi:hypothetical protein